MADACHGADATEVAVRLTNTERPVRGEDLLTTVQQLREFLDENDLSSPTEAPGTFAADADGPRDLTAADLDEVHELRRTVRGALERAGVDPHGSAALINEGLRRARVVPMLRPDGEHWRIESVAGFDRSAARLAAMTLGALAEVVATLGPGRLGVCAGADCRATFVDQSRNGSKQYCTRSCAHRASVAAYRRRQSPH